MKFFDAPLAEEFTPDGAGTDTSVLYPDVKTPDIDPSTGVVMIGRKNPNWDKMVDDENTKGNAIAEGDDGRYYSSKMPRFMAAPSLGIGSQDTEETWQENAKRDYDFAVKSGLPVGFFENIKNGFTSGRSVITKIPFFGGVYKTGTMIDAVSAAQRIQTSWDYTRPVAKKLEFDEIALGRLTREEINNDPYALNVYADEEEDKLIIREYLKYVSTDKTLMAKIGSGVANLPTFMIEFAATGGLASLGDDVAKKAGEKVLRKYAETKAGKLALRTAGWTFGSATRATIGLAPNVTGQAAERQLESLLGMREEEGWATSLLIAWGDVTIEAGSEAAGGAITKAGGAIASKLPFGNKVVPALEKAWVTATGGKKAEFVRKMASKGGYSNILGEIGEERLGTVLRAVTNVDDFGAGQDSTVLDRLKAGALQDYENKWVELGVLTAPVAGQYIASKIAGKQDNFFDDTFDQTVETEQAEEPDVVEPVSAETTIEETGEVPQGEFFETKEEVVGEVDAVVNPVTGQAVQTTAKEEVKPEEPTEEVAVEERKPLIPTKPVGIDIANTSAEVDQAVDRIVNGRTRDLTSARKADVQESRESAGLGGVASAERQTWQNDMQRAIEDRIPDYANDIAAEIISQPRPLTSVETAGLVVRAVQLKAEHKAQIQKMNETTNEEEIRSLSTSLERVQNKFDTLTEALIKSGTEKGRALASQKLTINQDFDIVSLKSMAKAKKGKPLTAKENKALEQMSKDLEIANARNEALQKKIDELMAKQFVKEGSVRRYSRMNKAERDVELESLVARTKQLLEEGCYR